MTRRHYPSASPLARRFRGTLSGPPPMSRTIPLLLLALFPLPLPAQDKEDRRAALLKLMETEVDGTPFLKAMPLEKFLQTLEAQLAEKKITFRVDKEAFGD